MKIAFNPSTVAALITPPNNKDITFDLRGRNIFARGVKFLGTDTNTWRDIKINNVSIGSNILDLRNGSNTTLTNTNGVVTINSTWRPVVDNLTSDSTTSSLSAKQGKVLKSLIDGKSNSGHTHDDRYLKLTGGTMASNALITFADSGSWGTDKGPQGARGGLYWTGQSDYAKLYAEETVGDNLDLVIQFGDDNSNGLSIRNKANTQTSYISAGGVITTGTFKGNLDWSYITNKPSSYTPSAHTHAWNSLTHSSTTENQAILTNGKANGWKLYTLNISRWDNAANNAHSHSNKSVLDGITSGLVNNWNVAYTFVNTITGTDTDKVINKWDEIVNFLAGITEDNKLNTLLNSKLSVYKLADNTNVGAIKNNGIYYSTSDASSGTLVNSPFNTGFALINMTSLDNGDDLRRSRLAFNAYGEVKISNDRGLANTAETWYNILTSNNSGINGSTIKLNGTSITVYSSSTADGRYVKKSGDTMSGALNFANGTWNLVGDDSYIGDCNISGHFGIKAANTTYPGIAFFNNANAHLGNLTAYNGNIKYGAYSLRFLDNGNTSVGASTWTNPFSGYNSNAVADGQAICVWGQSSSLSNLASDSGDMSLWLKRINANAATLNMVLDGEYYANGNLRLAHVSEIPNSLKNPYSLTTFGVVYDGSAAKTVTTSTFISLVTEGTSTVTDGTMFITSYASNSGFADTNAVNVPYKRKAIHLWEYIKTKTDSIYTTKSHNHDDRYVRAFGTSNDNIDSDWGLSFKTFDPIPSGTPPEKNPNISILNIGNNFNRRKLLAFIYSNDNIYYRRHTEGGFSNWRRIAFANEIPTSLKNPYALTISLNGTSQGPYDGSAAKNINITPGSIGAATSGHNHDGRYVYNYGGTQMDGASINKNALGMTTNSGITGDWWHILQAAWNGEYRWNSLIAFPTQNRNGMYYRSGLDDNTKWGSWVKLLDVNNYSSTLDSRYYTESEVNNLLNTKLNRQNLSYGTWNPRGYNLAADYSYNGGDLSISESGSKIHVSVDGYFWLNEGLYRVLDTSDVAGLKGDLTVHLYLSATDATWWPLIWGGSSHANTGNSTGAVYKSHDKLSWLTSSLTLHATNIQTNNIKNLSIGGGIYWNPYVESTTDGSDVASITLVKSGVAGGTTLVLSLMNDTNDTILFKTNGSARLYHNSYPILTTLNTYVSNNKGYINGTEITLVNNSDKVDNRHAISTTPNTGIIYKAAIYTSSSLTSYWVRLASIPSISLNGEFIATIHVLSGHSNPGRSAILLVYLRGSASSFMSKSFKICSNSNYDPNRFRLYYKDSDKTSEIWYQTTGLWDGIITTVISLGSEGSLYEGLTLYSGSITAVQTPSMSTYLSALVSTITDNISGNASTATKLKTPRTIWGQSFDGTRDVSGFMKNVTGLIHGNNIGDDWSDGNNTHPWYGIDYRHCVDSSETGKAYTSISSYFGLYFKTGGSRFIFDGGNVGIGTTSPIEKLDVHGNIISNNIRIYGNEVTNNSKGLFIQASDKTNRAYLTYNGNVENTSYLNICSTFGNIVLSPSRNVGIGTTTPAYKLHVNGTFRAANSTVSDLFVNTGDATLKIYTGITTDALNDGNICFLTSIDATDGQSHAYPTLYLNRCNIVLQPRGGLVYIGTNPGTGNITYKLYVNSKIFSNGGFVKNGSSDSYVLLGGGGHKAISDFAMSSHTHDDRYYTKAESNAKYITDITTSVNKLTFTKNGSNITRDITVNVVYSLGYLTNIPNKDATTKASSGLFIYNSYGLTIGTNSYSSVLSINTGGTIQIAGNWGDDLARNLYWRSLSDRPVADYPWKSWRTILDSENYSSTLDSRYYTESEVNNLLSKKLNTSDFNWTNLSGKLVAGNEFNIVNAGFNEGMWFNYVPINDRSKTATITGYHFGNGATGYTSINASGFIKKGSNSNYVLLGDGGHKLESSLRVAYASNADMVDGYHAASFLKDMGGGNWNFNFNDGFNSGIYYVHLQYTQLNAPSIYGLILDASTDAGHLQLASDYSNKYYIRGCWWTGGGGTWDSWRTIIHSGNIGSQSVNYATSAGNASTATALTTNAGNSINPIYFSGGKPIACTMSTGRGDGIVRSFSRGAYTSANLYFGNGTIVTIDPKGTGCISANDTILSLGDLAIRNTQLLVAYDRDGVYYRRITDGLSYGDWKRLAFTTDNVASATNADKLDGTHLNGIFTAFGNNAHNITATIGGVTKSFLVNWAADSDKLDGYHENSFLRYRGDTSTDLEATLWNLIGIKLYNNALPDNLTGVYNYGSVISLPGSSSRFEIYASHLSSNGNGLYYRSGWGSDKKTWLKFIDSSNIGSQSVNYANSAGNADKLDGIHANGLLTALSNTNNGISITVGGTTKSVSNISVNYASSAGSATKVIVNLHTTNDTNYPLVWSNLANSSTITENQLYKSWSDLYYNPKNKRLTVGGSVVASSFVKSGGTSLQLLRADGGIATFNWSGQSGLPTWLWGGNNLHSYYVYNPSNFRVAYATSAGSADTALYLRSLGNLNCQTGRTLNYGDVYTYNTYDGNTGSPTTFTSVIGFGRGIAGTVEIAGGWDNTNLYWRSLRDCCEDWHSWRTVLDSSNYTEFINNYYWANVKISTSSSTTTSPTVLNLTATSYIRMGNIYLLNTNEINSASGIHLNYQNSGNISLCYGGGKVGIGTISPTYKLDVNGNIHSSGTINCNALNVGSTLSIKDSIISCSASNISIESKESGSLLIDSRQVLRYDLDSIDISNKTSFGNRLGLTTGILGINYSTDDVTVLIGSLRESSFFEFRPAMDGLLLFLKVGKLYSNTNFWCTTKNCEVIKANNFGTYLARNSRKDCFGDGEARIFIYKLITESWYEFYCG